MGRSGRRPRAGELEQAMTVEQRKKNLISVDEYIAQFEEEIQTQLKKLRDVIREAAPEAKEKLAWGVPTYYLNGFLVEYGINKKTLALYFTPSTINHFKKELETCKTNRKNVVQFQVDEELPWEMIRQMITYRRKESDGQLPFA